MKDLDTPLEVELGFNLFQITSLDGKTQVMVTSGQLQMAWNHPDISWNVSEYGGIYQTELPHNLVWTPFVGLRNSARHVYDQEWVSGSPVIVFSNGRFVFGPIGQFFTTCDLNMYQFPYDTQHCCLDFGSIMHETKYFNLSTIQTEVNMEEFQQSNEFDVLTSGVRQGHSTLHVPIGVVHLPKMKFCIALKRLPVYYVINLIAPVSVLSIMSSFTFLVPYESGEKLSLSITILLAFSVYGLILSDITPQSSGPVPTITLWMLTTIAFNGISVIIHILTLKSCAKGHGKPPPKWLRRIASCCCNNGDKTMQLNKIQPLEEEGEQENAKLTSIETNTTSSSDTNSKRGNRNVDQLENILEELKKVTAVIDFKTDEKALEEEWQTVTTSFNNMMFFLFFFGNNLVSIAFLYEQLKHIAKN